jgi:hypothetical protein
MSFRQVYANGSEVGSNKIVVNPASGGDSLCPAHRRPAIGHYLPLAAKVRFCQYRTLVSSADGAQLPPIRDACVHRAAEADSQGRRSAHVRTTSARGSSASIEIEDSASPVAVARKPSSSYGSLRSPLPLSIYLVVSDELPTASSPRPATRSPAAESRVARRVARVIPHRGQYR